MGSFAGGLPDPAVLAEIEARGLLFELLARPHQLAAAAEALAPYDGLTVVVEHTGWLQTGTDEERAVWESGLADLAGLGERVVCKLSGLAAAVGSMDAEGFRPYLDHAIGLFGIDRCVFASNFPVDGLHGTLDALWSAYSEATAGYTDTQRDQLFATNAERLYRI
jgi:predicted TIM-barrel fold metal-dependent hydrolase